MNKISVGVLGASGYAGRELCDLVARHPAMDLAFAAANSRAGESVRIAGRETKLIAAEKALLGATDLVFAALPHGTSLVWVEKASAAGARVIDLSADLRPGNGADHSHIYSGKPAVPYGLTELNRAALPKAKVVANPGCYATAILIALAPFIRRGLLVQGSTINVSAASGVTGAGNSPKPELMFAEVADDFRAYAVGNEHRHLGEMRATLSALGGDSDILFTPHLLPVARGIIATITLQTTETIGDPNTVLREAYTGEPFIEVSDCMPSLRDVVRRNVVRMSATKAANVRKPTVIIIAAIDNLVKGAAGQAVQNANVMFGFEETSGLPA